MMTNEIKANYTDTETAELIAQYKTGTSVETLAVFFSKTTKSIVAKLVREQVYVPKTKVAGHAAVSKAELIAKIALAIGATETVLESLEKATKAALEAVANYVAKQP